MIYISSSWKNRTQVRELAVLLRQQGYEVYDFTDPSSRQGVPEIPPEAFPEQFDPNRHNYRAYLNSVPQWRAAVECNKDALKRCTLVVLLLPCGNDAHADAFYGLGLGRRLVVVGHPHAGDRTPTHMWAESIVPDAESLIAWLEAAS